MKFSCAVKCTTVVLLLLTIISNVQGKPNKKIAIIGGGISGASTSFYITEFLKNKSMSAVDITVFERRDYIGGRLKHIRYGKENIKIEIGGAAWTNDNIYMTEMANAVGINVTRRKIIGNDKAKQKQFIATDNDIGVWDGDNIINLETFGIQNLVQALKIGENEVSFLKRIKENYEIQKSSAFHNLTSFLKWGDINMYTNRSMHDFFTSTDSASSDFIEIGMVPLNRAIYNQGSKANAFGFLASLTAQLSQHTVTNGNSELVKKLFEYSKSNVLLKTNVTRISMSKRENSDGKYTNYFTIQYNKTLSDTFDAVVIASPLEVTGIEFENIRLAKGTSINRNYFDWYVTVVEASSINMNQFKPYIFPAGKQVPNLIVTTSNVTGNSGFVCMQPLGRHAKTPAPANIWMVYSDVSIKSNIEKFFINPNTETVYEHYWPYTFPHLNVISDKNANVQPLILNEADGGGLYNANVMEFVATAMEISSIGGRNVGKLIQQYLRDNNEKYEARQTVQNRKPPTLPVAFTANVTRTVHYSSMSSYSVKEEDPPISNFTLYLDLPHEKQYIADYSTGYLVQSWSLFNLSPPKIWTYDRYDIPQPPHCICLTTSPPLLPEFLDIKNATYHGTDILRKNVKTDKWIVENELISGDRYIVWTKEATNIPVRVQWIDPEGKNTTMTETSDYFNFINHAPDPKVFDVNSNCIDVKCN